MSPKTFLCHPDEFWDWSSCISKICLELLRFSIQTTEKLFVPALTFDYMFSVRLLVLSKSRFEFTFEWTAGRKLVHLSNQLDDMDHHISSKHAVKQLTSKPDKAVVYLSNII